MKVEVFSMDSKELTFHDVKRQLFILKEEIVQSEKLSLTRWEGFHYSNQVIWIRVFRVQIKLILKLLNECIKSLQLIELGQ